MLNPRSFRTLEDFFMIFFFRKSDFVRLYGVTEISGNRVGYPPKAILRSQLTPGTSETHIQCLW